MEILGLLLSVVYDVLKDKKFSIPTLNGIISNCIDKVSQINGVNRSYLIELLSSDEIQHQVKNYKKSGLEPDRMILCNNLRNRLHQNNVNADANKIVNDIIYELENVISANTEIYNKILLNYSRNISEKTDSMSAKVDKIYEILRQNNSKPTTGDQGDGNTFTGYGFRISWPESWIKLTESEISDQLDNLEEIQSMVDMPKMRIPVVFQVWTKKEYDGYHPNIFVTVEKAETDKIADIHNPSTKKAFKDMATVVRYDVDEHFNTATIETQETLFGDSFQIQKWIIKNGQLFNLVITEIVGGAMKNEPDLFDEIASIIRSFTWV